MLRKIKMNIDTARIKNFITTLWERLRRSTWAGKTGDLTSRGREAVKVLLSKLSKLAVSAHTKGKAYLNELTPLIQKVLANLRKIQPYIAKIKPYIAKVKPYIAKIRPLVAQVYNHAKQFLSPMAEKAKTLAKKLSPYVAPVVKVMAPYWTKISAFSLKIIVPLRSKALEMGAKVKPALTLASQKIKELGAKAWVHVKSFRFNPRSRRQQVAFGTLVFFLLAGTAYAFSTANRAYVVTLNGKQIAIVRDLEAAEKAMDELFSEQSGKIGVEVFTKDKIAYTKTKAKNYQISSLRSLQKKMDSRVSYLADATVLTVNGREEIVVKDRSAGDSVLEDLKQYYLGKTKSVNIESLKFEEKIAFLTKTVPIDQIITPHDAVPIIVKGRNKILTYKVQDGDSLWLIARKNDTHVSDLKEANPSLTGERLHIGDTLNLTKITPLINVVMKATVVKEEAVAYGVRVIRNSKMDYGKEVVKQQGVAGKKEVTYNLVMRNGQVIEKKVLRQVVLAKPSAKVVERGSNLYLASRGGRSTGVFAWPLRGRVNSPFGWRWGRMHSGIDIEGSTGQPFYASDGGVVIFSGYDGAYGKVIRISHGNGIVTTYSHNSANLVRVGQRVSRGQLIGRVGATGNATGSHLHFQIDVGGVPRNPLKYL